MIFDSCQINNTFCVAEMSKSFFSEGTCTLYYLSIYSI